MTAKLITRKILKITACILGGILALLVTFHFWFINHAEELVEDLVNSQSSGKIHLKVKKFKFNWFSRKMELQNAVFYSTDTVIAPVAYRFGVKRLKIQVKAVWPLIFEKKFDIDSLHLFDPDISVTKLRSVRDTSSVTDTSLSIPQEMGRIYHSIQDALQVLKVDRFQIDNGKFSLINKTNPNEQPVRITNLYFHLDKLKVDSSEQAAEQKILFSDNVALQTTHQDILFPDGRHRLSFSNFRINLRNKLAEFDSCTIVATKGDSSNSSFRIFFDKLRMTNIDFDTLYRAEVIKADSVYCINPRFKLDVALAKKTGPVTPPKLDDLIQQLTGDLQVAFVVVQNGSFDITTMRDGRPSSFTSDNNNFELQGLRIRKAAPKPFMVDRFAMAIRNYENFLRDSAYAIQFDSVIINNNRVSLSNFSYQELTAGKTVNSLRMPQFELYGLSWDDLVFDQQLKAERATLYKPVINYDLTKSKNKTGKDVFATLAGIGDKLQLNNLNIVDGQVNLFFKNKAQLRLEKTTLLLLGQQLVASRQVAAVRRSVNALRFEKGIFSMGDFSAELKDVQFAGINNHLQAGTLRIRNKDVLAVDASKVNIQSMVMNDKLQHITINGISWNEATMQLSAIPSGKPGKGNRFLLNDIKGNNTSITVLDRSRKMTGLIRSVEASSLLVEGSDVQLKGSKLQAENIAINDSLSSLSIDAISLTDKQASSLKNFTYALATDNDSITISIPSAYLSPDINAIIHGNIKASDVQVDQPIIHMRLAQRNNTEQVVKKFPVINIDKLLVLQPSVDFSNKTEKGVSGLVWPKQENDLLEFSGLQTNSQNGIQLSAEQVRFAMNHFIHHSTKGKNFDAGKGKLTGQLNKLLFQENEGGNWDWQGVVSDLSANDFTIDSIGKKAGQLKIVSARVNDLALSSSYLLNFRELVKHNNQFRLRDITGSYKDSSDQLAWFNASYDKRKKIFALDSFHYSPTPDMAAFAKKQRYQDDYLIVKTGAIRTGPFDIERFVRDTILDIGVVNIDNSYISDFRDKRIPREPGIVRPLLVNMVRKISVKLQADTIKVNNARAEYEEVNEKTGKGGRIEVNALYGEITHLRNFNLTGTDSLQIRANGLVGGKIRTGLAVKESYADPLGGFVMTVHMGAADLTALNPILGALASAELKSGMLDTLTMSVVGREELAFGEMKMLYHNLKVKVLKDGDREKKSFLNGVINFLANTIIKNKNTHKDGTVFFRRLKDRSSINYLVKITLSGVISNVGIGKTKKQARQHKKEINSHPLPPVKKVQL